MQFLSNNLAISDSSESSEMNKVQIIQHEQQKRYRKKYKFLKTRAKSLILENAALCDEVARIQESIAIVKDERKFLLRKLLEYEHDAELQAYYRNEPHFAPNGPRSKLKKRRSYDEGGKCVS